MSVQVHHFPVAGGLDLDTQSLTADPGTCISMVNFEIDTNGSPRRIGGYAKWDANPVPGDALFPLGVVNFNSEVYAFGTEDVDVSGTITPMTRVYRSSGSGWTTLGGESSRVDSGLAPWIFTEASFTGDPDNRKLFGANGNGKAVQIGLDDVMTLITTGATTDEPTVVCAHKNHLFLGFRNGSVIFSAIGDPLSYAAGAGAGEIAFGAEVTNMIPGPGGSLIITSYQRVFILYGSSSADWQTEEITLQADSSGAYPATIQGIGGQPVFFDGGAIRALSTTSAFSNFNYSTLSQKIRTLLREYGSGPDWRASSLVFERDMYRLYNRGIDTTTIVSMTMRGSKVLGFGISQLPLEIWCVDSVLSTNGGTRTVFGALDGYIYQLDTGTSFDGAAIPAALRLHFNHLGSPSHQKRWRKAWFDIESPAPVTLQFQPTFSFGNGDDSAVPVGLSEASPIAGITGIGGLWDVSEWGEFYWDGSVVNEGAVGITGSGRSISMSIFIEADDVEPFTINGLVLHYSMRGQRR